MAPGFHPVWRQVVNIENYQPGNSLYWEVAILDPEGYVWQYHHIDRNTIPQSIFDKYNEWKAIQVQEGMSHRIPILEILFTGRWYLSVTASTTFT